MPDEGRILQERRKENMKKLVSMLLALLLACVALTGAMAEEAVDPQELLHAVSGTYTEL